ncbi:hypothetical protein SAMN05880574_1512 [Chryseobacterium sp. RU37D]|nr:hypothetical protein SAMN05880574_1512 [Chryseobacterium sp. RU37D]
MEIRFVSISSDNSYTILGVLINLVNLGELIPSHRL